MKALVTGASGFIGSTLIGELDTLGFEVRALLRKSSSLSNLEGMRFQRVEGDLNDFDSLCRAVKDVDYVFHLAGVTHAPSRAAFIEYNAKGTDRIAKAVAKVRPQLTRFVYVSSLAAAGPAHSLRPKVESERAQPVSRYGESKLLGEKELLKYKDAFPVAIVRPPLVYGPKDRSIFFMIQTLTRNLMPVLQGSNRAGHKYYSSIHAEDLCKGIVQVAVASKEKVPSGDLFYLAEDEVHTYQEMLTTIIEKLNCDPLRVRIPKFAIQLFASGLSTVEMISRRALPLNWDKLNELIPDYWICSNKKAKKTIQFMPEYDLTKGLVHAIDWYKRQGWL
jgi:dihydroflavonol-4-reductase